MRTSASPAMATANALTSDRTVDVGCRNMATPFVNPPGSQAVHASRASRTKPDAVASLDQLTRVSGARRRTTTANPRYAATTPATHQRTGAPLSRVSTAASRSRSESRYVRILERGSRRAARADGVAGFGDRSASPLSCFTSGIASFFIAQAASNSRRTLPGRSFDISEYQNVVYLAGIPPACPSSSVIV